MSAGSSGANQTWNFSSLSSSGTTTYDYVSPSSTPNGSSFPMSNLATSQGAYYNQSASAYTQVGIDASTMIVYSDGEDLLRFPFNYNDSYVDNFAAQFTNGGITFNRTGTISVTYDSYGTLVLPGGTYNNVVRVHIVQDYQDDYTIAGTPSTINYDSDIYVWYLPGTHNPILSFSSISIDGGAPTSYGYMDEPTVGVDEEDNTIELSVFPNPTSDQLFINMEDNEGAVNFTLVSSSGQVVKTGTLNSQSNTVNVSDLSTGIYFLNVQSDKKQAFRKVIVE